MKRPTQHYRPGLFAIAILLLVAGLIVAVRQHATAPAGGPDNNGNYPLHRNITATVFWIGEPADDSNDQISNVPTAWDGDATKRFGGADGPRSKDGAASDIPRDSNGIVTSFKPLQNPYYFALPAIEFNEDGTLTAARGRSPWAGQSVNDDQSLLKGRWVKLTTSDNKTAYAQWLDVGPNEERDYDYVFGDGSRRPKNTFGLRAGIDLSPATATALGFSDDSKQVGWRFIDANDVPDGPWKKYPAINNTIYSN